MLPSLFKGKFCFILKCIKIVALFSSAITTHWLRWPLSGSVDITAYLVDNLCKGVVSQSIKSPLQGFNVYCFILQFNILNSNPSLTLTFQMIIDNYFVIFSNITYALTGLFSINQTCKIPPNLYQPRNINLNTI